MRSLVNSSSTVIAAALNCAAGITNGSTRRESPVLTRRSLRCTPLRAMVPGSTSGWGLQKSTRSPNSAYGTNASSAAFTNAAFVREPDPGSDSWQREASPSRTEGGRARRGATNNYGAFSRQRRPKARARPRPLLRQTVGVRRPTATALMMSCGSFPPHENFGSHHLRPDTSKDFLETSKLTKSSLSLFSRRDSVRGNQSEIRRFERSIRFYPSANRELPNQRLCFPPRGG